MDRQRLMLHAVLVALAVVAALAIAGTISAAPLGPGLASSAQVPVGQVEVEHLAPDQLLGFGAAAYTIPEAAGGATITVTLDIASAVTATVAYATSDGTAEAGSDYQSASGVLTFTPGVTARTFAVPILDDLLEEPDEMISLTLESPKGAALGVPAVATLTILNDDHYFHMPWIVRKWPPIPDTPWLNAISNPDGDGNYTVSWSSAARAQSYTLEEATNAGFGGAVVVYQGPATAYDISSWGQPIGTSYYYRVRANNTWGYSPWSNIQSTLIAPIPWVPTLYGISNSDGDGNYTVSWSTALYAETYTLEEATNASFSGAVVVYQGAATAHAVSGRPFDTYYYRVRGNNPWEYGPWSDVQSTTVWAPSTFYASGDTMITQGYPTVNTCDTIDMWAGYDDYLSPDGRIVRSLVQFDLSSVPPGTAINQARLFVRLYAYWDYPNRTRTITVYRVGSGWSECSVTWSTQPGMAESYSAQAVGQNVGSWYAFDVTNLVRGWVNGTFANFGLWLRGPEQSGSDSSWRAFLTSNSSSAPYLSISYGAGVAAAEDSAGERAAPGSVAGPSAMDVLGEPDPADPCAGVWVSGRRCLEVAP